MRLRLAVLMLLYCVPIAAESGESTLCAPHERVVFSCRAAGKILSLCALPSAQSFDAIEYRYGSLRNIQLRYRATQRNNKRFYAYSEPVAPGAVVNQVWFDRAEHRYLISRCEGGDCPAKAGLIVYRRNKPIRAAKCEGGFDEHAWFDPAVIEFKSNFAESSSKTPLLVLEETAHDIASLYPYRLSR
jgi:hypothetical protein